MSHIVPSNQVDSAGGDCTNPDTHTIRVAIVVDETGGGGGGGGGAVTIADGADVAQGSRADVAVTTNTPGTVIGFLRGLVTILSSAWDVTAGRLLVGVTQTEKSYTHSFSAPGIDWDIDVSRFTVISVRLGAGTTNNDGQWAVYLSNDGGVTFTP